jgi:hypothetical protein
MLRRRLKEPFGKAGLTVAICALVLALVGGAYAAGGLTKSQEKQVTKIAKKYAGKPGAPGLNGTNGTNGGAGEKGPKGDPGSPGEAGESVTVTPEGECTKFSNKSGTGKACDGETGFTETLPSEKTETGAWSIASPNPANALVSVSFPIPLPSALDATHVHFVGESGAAPDCLGTVQEPSAEAGNLCIYYSFTSGTEGQIVRPAGTSPVDPTAGAARNGALLSFFRHGEEEVTSWGSWAVTAP